MHFPSMFEPYESQFACFPGHLERPFDGVEKPHTFRVERMRSQRHEVAPPESLGVRRRV